MEPQSIFVDPQALYIGQDRATPSMRGELSQPPPSELAFIHDFSPVASTSANPLPTQTSSEGKDARKEKACAPCRVRRVRCDRVPNHPDCLKCQEKKIACTPMPKVAKKKNVFPTRTGKRIEEAIALFGTRDDGDQVMEQISSESVAQQNNQMTVASKLFSNTFGTMQPTSAVNRLHGSELAASTISSLMDFYLHSTQDSNSVLESIGFRQMYEAAGRRIDALPIQAQVLASVVVAISARSSDHPMLIGTNGLKSDELCDQALAGRSMLSYGRNREAACMDLQERAVKFADEAGTLRHPAVESIAALQLLESLVFPMKFVKDQGSSSFSQCSAYAVAYTGHTRALLWKDADNPSPEERKRLDVVAWLSYTRDCKVAIRLGRQSSFSEDDLELLRNGKEVPPPFREAILAHTDEPAEDIRRIVWSIMWELAEYSKKGAILFTTLKARRNPHFNIEFALDYLATLQAIDAAIPELQNRMVLLEQQNDRLGTRPKGSRQVSWAAIRVMRTSIAATTFLLHNLVCRRLLPDSPCLSEREREWMREVSNWWPQIPAPLPSHGDEAYWNALNGLAIQTGAMCLHSVRFLARLFQGTLTHGISTGGSEWMDGVGIQQLFSRLRWWLLSHLLAPTTEEGGTTPGFDFATKLEELRWIHRAVVSLGWSFEELGKQESWVADEIVKLEKLRAAHYRHNAPSYGSTTNGVSSSTSEPAPLLDPQLSFLITPEFSPPSVDSPCSSSNLSSNASSFDSNDPLFNDFSADFAEGIGQDPFAGMAGFAPMMSEEELNKLLSTEFGNEPFGSSFTSNQNLWGQ